MKRTLLDYTQTILSALGSDEVNSISDTTESLQVAEIVKTSFFNMISRSDLPEQRKPYQLIDATSALTPNLMYIPDGTQSIDWLKYFDTTSVAEMYKYVTILPIQQFTDMVNSFNTSNANTQTLSLTVDNENFLFNYTDDAQPLYCTVISNYYVVFDSFNSNVESTLQAVNTMAFGLTKPTWAMEDTFIPALDDQQVPLLLNEAKSLAFFELKQQPHTKAEQELKRQWSSLQKDKSVDGKPGYFDQLPNFGRQPVQTRAPKFKW